MNKKEFIRFILFLFAVSFLIPPACTFNYTLTQHINKKFENYLNSTQPSEAP